MSAEVYDPCIVRPPRPLVKIIRVTHTYAFCPRGFFVAINSVAAEITSGDSITLRDISRQFSTAPSTTLRWVLRGLPDGHGGRIRLEAIRRGKPWLTSRAALQRFLSRLPQSAPGTSAAPIRTPSQRERDSARAKQQLHDAYGI